MAKDNEMEWGKRMIKLSVQFWTNDLPKGSDNKTAWESGAIHVIAHKARKLSHDHIFFRDLDDFIPKLAELLKRNDIKLKKKPKNIENVDLDRLRGEKKYKG